MRVNLCGVSSVFVNSEVSIYSCEIIVRWMSVSLRYVVCLHVGMLWLYNVR
jgi:hypothetical protein